METFRDKYRPRKWVSISDAINYDRCPRKCFYNTCCGAGTGESIAMKFGEAIHAGLPVAATKGPAEALVEFLKVWEERDGLQDPNRNSFKAGDIFTAYADLKRDYKLLPFKRSDIESVNEFEIPFILHISKVLPMVGRFDGLCELNGKKYVVEYKTSSELSSRTTTAWQLSPQLIGYCMAASILLGEKVGTILEVIRTTKNVAFETCLRDYSDENITYFVNWMNNTIEKIKESETIFLNSSKPYDGFPKKFTGCHPYCTFGVHGYLCEFATLCEMSDEVAWTLVETVSFSPERPYESLVNPKLDITIP